MMSGGYVLDLYCDTPTSAEHPGFEATAQIIAATRVQAVQQALARGWLLSADKHYCPRCKPVAAP